MSTVYPLFRGIASPKPDGFAEKVSQWKLCNSYDVNRIICETLSKSGIMPGFMVKKFRKPDGKISKQRAKLLSK